MLKHLPILALLPCLILSQCQDKAKFAEPTDCAILYKLADCKGEERLFAVGHTPIDPLKPVDGSVAVKKGCTLTFYEFSENAHMLGKSEVFEAKDADLHKDGAKIKSLDPSSAKCTC